METGRSGQPGSWVASGLILIAFAIGGVAPILHQWWLFWAALGTFGAGGRGPRPVSPGVTRAPARLRLENERVAGVTGWSTTTTPGYTDAGRRHDASRPSRGTRRVSRGQARGLDSHFAAVQTYLHSVSNERGAKRRGPVVLVAGSPPEAICTDLVQCAPCRPRGSRRCVGRRSGRKPRCGLDVYGGSSAQLR